MPTIRCQDVKWDQLTGRESRANLSRMVANNRRILSERATPWYVTAFAWIVEAIN